MSEYDDFHPVSNLFPLLTGDDFDQLVADIRAHGVREPIWRHRDGKIIDGRNRWLAAQVAGVDCPSRTFEGGDADLLAFAVSQNLRRRHLNTSQRAMIAAELATLQQGARTDIAPNDAMSDAQAASLLNVSERSVERAKQVRREAIPELVAAVERGELRVSRAAEIARADPDRQRRIVRGEGPIAKPASPSERLVRVTYWDPAPPMKVRVITPEPRPQPDITKPAVERPGLQTALTDLRASFWATDRLTPEEAAAALSPESRLDYMERARKQQAWLTEFLCRLALH